jgi:glutathione S-transferase
MSLVLHYHPLSSFCWKVLIALYEAGTAFTPAMVNPGDPASRAAHLVRWPLGRIPVLDDAARGLTLPETSIIIEYLEQQHPGPRPLLPADPAARLRVRLWDRVFDLYVSQPMQKIVGDRLRPPGTQDPRGVAEARALLRDSYALLEAEPALDGWATAERFTLADCAALPALFYAAVLEPFAPEQRRLAAYFERLVARPSVARVLAEARPWFAYFPYRGDLPARFLGS